MLSERPVLGTRGMVACAHFPDGVAYFLDLLDHRTLITGPWEDGMGHVQGIVIRPSNSMFEGAADPRCDGLALGW